MKKIKIVLGTFFGDEGKGQTVHNLCKEVPMSSIVIRFNGGNQAGHTVRHGESEHTFSNFGSGTFLGVPTYWSEYCAVDPITAALEKERLVKGFSITPRVMYSPNCEVITPLDVYAQRGNVINMRHGSVGTGYKSTLDRVKAGFHITVQDCLNRTILREKLIQVRDVYYYNRIFALNFTVEDIEDWVDRTHAYFMHAIILTFDDAIKPFGTLIFEGGQGILLDQTYGVMPFCTPSNTTSENVYKLLSKSESLIPARCEIKHYYVMRPYITRHGNGPMLTDKPSRPIDDLNNRPNDYQGTMRAVEFDYSLLIQAFEIDNIFKSSNAENVFVVTHIDEPMPNHFLDTVRGMKPSAELILSCFDKMK